MALVWRDPQAVDARTVRDKKMRSRIISGLIAIAYVTTAYFADGGDTAFRLGLFLILPLACIWFSEEMGSLTGVVGGRLITSTTPGWLVALGGWLLLFLPVIMWLIQYFIGNE